MSSVFFSFLYVTSQGIDRGNIDMTRILPFLGNTELEILSVVGSFLLILTHAITAYCTKEKVVVAGK